MGSTSIAMGEPARARPARREPGLPPRPRWATHRSLRTLIVGPLTLGLWSVVPFVWVLVDFVLILTGGVRDRDGPAPALSRVPCGQHRH